VLRDYSDIRRPVADGFSRFRGFTEGSTAFLAELGVGRVGQTALRASAFERLTALDAKLRAGGILGPAF
jgi:hypothetical protein